MGKAVCHFLFHSLPPLSLSLSSILTRSRSREELIPDPHLSHRLERRIHNIHRNNPSPERSDTARRTPRSIPSTLSFPIKLPSTKRERIQPDSKRYRINTGEPPNSSSNGKPPISSTFSRTRTGSFEESYNIQPGSNLA